MRILILISNNPHDGFLVRLKTRKLIKELKSLLDKRKKTLAIRTALAKGSVERQVAGCDTHSVEADLILTKDAVRWDLKKGTEQ